MKTKSDAYQPINCGFHDYLEHYATLRQTVKLTYSQNDKIIHLTDAVIFDLSGGRNGEYAHIKSGTDGIKIRMDHIISIADIKAESFGKDYCSFRI